MIQTVVVFSSFSYIYGHDRIAFKHSFPPTPFKHRKACWLKKPLSLETSRNALTDIIEIFRIVMTPSVTRACAYMRLGKIDEIMTLATCLDAKLHAAKPEEHDFSAETGHLGWRPRHTGLRVELDSDLE